MKATKTLFIAALAVGSLLALSPALRAQDEQKPAKPEVAPPGPHGPGANFEERVNHWAEALGLSKDTKAKFKATLQEENNKGKEIRNDSNLTDDQKKEKRKALREETNSKLKGILTAEQFEKWQKMRSPGRGPGGPGGHGGPPPEKKSESTNTNTSTTTSTQK